MDDITLNETHAGLSVWDNRPRGVIGVVPNQDTSVPAMQSIRRGAYVGLM